MNIPFLSFETTNKKVKAEVLESFEHFFDKSWYILGEGVKKFEEDYAAYNKVSYVIGVSNGLDALHLSLKALDIGSGDEVIVPSNTYIATVLAISYVGATPVFVEPNINTYNIDISKIEAAITGRTKAIIPVHLYGQCCEMDGLLQIAKKNNLFIVEDNAQSQGATYNGKKSGSFGHLNATSFYPGKNLGAYGDAGAITTNDEKLAQKVITLRNYGSSKKYYNEIIGFNMRLDECQAMFLSVKLKYLEEWTRQRVKVASWYNESLVEVDSITLPMIAPGATHVYHQYVIRSKQRDKLQEHLSKNNIGTLIHYPVPPHLQEAYAYLGYGKGSFPIAEEISDTCLSLPIWPGIKREEVGYIAETIRKFKG